MMHDRIPPHSLDAEMVVLGALLVDHALIAQVAQTVTGRDFYAEIHGIVFGAICGLDDAGKPSDKIAVCDYLRSRGLLEKVGGPSYLSSLMDTVQTASTVAYYATIVSEKAQLRRLIEAGNRIASLGYEGELDVTEALSSADAILHSVGSLAGSGGQSALDVAKSIYHELEARMMGTLPSVQTGFPAIDNATGGLTGEDLLTIAAAPGMGKSSLAMQIAENVAFTHGPVAVFALEMGAMNTLRRVIAARAQVSITDMRRGKVGGRDMDRIGEAMGYVSKMPIKLFGSVPRKGVNDIRRLCRDMKRSEGLSMIIVDHPGYLREASGGRESKNDRLETAYLDLSQCGKECSVPIVIVQHLNREGMSREIPTLQDLRGGGNLEGVSNIVLFPNRANPINQPTVGEFILAKNRDGEPGRYPMTFNGSRFQWVQNNAALGSHVA